MQTPKGLRPLPASFWRICQQLTRRAKELAERHEAPLLELTRRMSRDKPFRRTQFRQDFFQEKVEGTGLAGQELQTGRIWQVPK